MGTLLFPSPVLLYYTSFIYLSLVVLPINTKNDGQRSFVIDYPGNRFLKDGAPYQYISGSIHYFRIPSFYWPDRLTKIKAAGLTAVEFYIPWNIHEPQPGNFTFDGDNDVVHFLNLCRQLNLDAIVRLGPYTCGEFENGGLPWWLLKLYPDIRMRTADRRFLFHMTKWYVKLMPMLQPLLYENGGPIISMQVENEYGSRQYCDREYTTFLRDLIRSYVGPNFVLFTVDGAGVDYLKCGYIPDVYPTVDFGCGSRDGVKNAFDAQRAFTPNGGPLVNTEFYPGWLDLWGLNHSTLSTDQILNTMQYMYEMGASFNFYMFEGGTNFGYMNGASSDNEPVTTSYDYDAPLSEAGDPTPKFHAIRRQIEILTGTAINQSVPEATAKFAYGRVPLSLLSDLGSLLTTLSPTRIRKTSKYPLTFEQLDFPYGFILYETTINFPCSCNISVPGINDRGYVIIANSTVGKLIVKRNTSVTTKGQLKSGTVLQILVENNGRQCSGFNDPKGLNGNVTADGSVLTDWTFYPIQIENVFKLLEEGSELLQIKQNGFQSAQNETDFRPSIYYGKFPAAQIGDTYFDPTGWAKGQLFVNGFNVGRYWPSLGPQVTLYVPKTAVKKLNYLVLLELEKAGNCFGESGFTCEVSFLDVPILNKTVIGPQRKDYRKNSKHRIH